MKTKSFSQKLIVCLLAGLVTAAAYLRIGNKFFTAVIPLNIVLGIAVLLLLIAITYSFIWQQREKKGNIDSLTIRAFWIAVIRYSIAFDLATFGFQKIFHLQFLTPMGMLDEPFSSFSGEWLTWSYFGHSYPFIFVIGVLQIGGSFLLLFNRTRLLGLMVIMPVLLNIVLIDFFYGLAPGVLAHAVFMLAAAIYLMLLDYDRLVLFFLRFNNIETSFAIQSNALKNVGRFSILFVPLILIGMNKSPNEHPELKGKYAVTDMVVNGKQMKATACQDSLLTVVYFDLGNDCVFEYNNIKRRLFGLYELDTDQQIINVNWHYPQSVKDKFTGKLKLVQNGVELNGRMGKDSLQLKLKRLLK